MGFDPTHQTGDQVYASPKLQDRETWYVKNGGNYILDFQYAPDNSSLQGNITLIKFRYSLEYRRVFSPQLMINPLVMSSLNILILMNLTDVLAFMGLNLPSLSLRGRIMNRLNNLPRYRNFLLSLVYYWRLPAFSLEIGFTVITALLLDVTKLTGLSYDPVDLVFIGFSQNILLVVLYSLFFILIGVREFSLSFPEQAYFLSYPMSKVEIWLIRAIYVIKESLFSSLNIFITILIIRYYYILNVDIPLFYPLITIIIHLGMFTMMLQLIYILIYIITANQIQSISITLLYILISVNINTYGFIPTISNLIRINHGSVIFEPMSHYIGFIVLLSILVVPTFRNSELIK